MEYLADDRKLAMGEFHNKVVVLIDQEPLSPPEMITVLRMLANNIEKLFEISVKGG